MGIKNLMKLIKDKSPNAITEMDTSQFKNKKIAIDTSIILYQSVIAIKSKSNLVGPTGKSTSHILGILLKTLYYLKIDVIPIHIFDGKPPELKMKVLEDRFKIRQNAIDKLIEIEDKVKDEEKDEDEISEIDKLRLIKQSISISNEDISEVKEIVKLLGVPYIEAPQEADSQCAYLSRNNLVDYVASEDMDILTFGCKNLLKGFMKRNMININLEMILSEMEINMDQFIDLCILLGCDYTDSIDGVGLKKAYDLIKKYKNIEMIITKEKKIAQGIYKLPHNFRYDESREYFNNPRHIKIKPDDLILKEPKFEQLKELLIDKYGFKNDYVDSILKFLKKKYNIIDNCKDSDECLFDD
jgi:flap endonuclease-1